jgi:hypothetical protein
MTSRARLSDTLPVLSEAGAELVRDIQARQQIEIRLANTFLVLSRQQARGLLLELATFLSESDSDKTPCVITLD